MTSGATLQPDPSPILACTVSRDVQNFDLLIEDMEAALGEAWGDLGFAEAIAFFDQEESASLEFISLAIDKSDEASLGQVTAVITRAKAKGIKVILIAEDVTPASLHQLLRQGADEFVPYPLPEGELNAAIERLRAPEPEIPAETAQQKMLSGRGDKEAAIFGVQGLAGGTGATTFAVNLAWELATADKKSPPKVCLIDFGLQFGTVATYLDLPRRDAVYELLSDTESMDDDSFGQALLSYEDKLQVLTAPVDILPLDMITPDDVSRIIDTASRHFDYVIIDMPSTVVQWTETVLSAAHIYFATIELDMRSAQNTLRFKRALQSEDLPLEKLRYLLNRAPKFTDLNGKARVKRLAESLDISIDVQLPDGGKQVVQSGDHGTPLGLSAAKSPLRKEIAKLAASLHELGRAESEAA